MQSSAVLKLFKKLAASCPQLEQEQQRREHRPNVPDTFRDDIQLDFMRFVLWSVMLFVEPKHWLQVAQGGFGTVYKVTDVSPPIAVSGTFYQTVAIKIPNSADAVEELKAEVESLSVLTHGALLLFCSCCCLMHPNRLIEQIACDRKRGPDSGDDGRPGS